MRVLVIANNFPSPENPYNGAFNLRQIRALRELGHDVHVLRWVPWSPPYLSRRQQYRSVPTRYAVDGVPVHTLRGLLGPKSFGLGTIATQAFPAIRREVAAVNPDIVHVQGLMPSGVLALACNKPFVLTAHGSETYRIAFMRPGLKATARRVLQRANACVGVSQFIADRSRELGASDPQVIYNGADDSVFTPGERGAARERFGVASSARVVSFVGYLQRGKGVFDLMDAVSMMRVRPIVLVAGEGDERDALAQYAQDRNVDLRLLGALDHAALADVYRAADVFTLPSYAEGLPSVICEAMNCGVPVVATRQGGIPEIVEDGVSGYVIESGDRARLADTLETLCCDEALRDRMGAAGLQFARAHLTWKKNALAYATIYEKIVRASARAAV